MTATKQAAILRANFANTDARYVAADYRLGYLVTADKAKRFSSVKAAEKFLRENPHYKNFWAQTV